jgi:flagellar basal-body rod modification protein FlgD
LHRQITATDFSSRVHEAAERKNNMSLSPVQAVGQVSNDQLQSSSPTGLQALTPSDFINLMVTELQNQDPTQPESSDQLLSQMSEIGQLQSSDTLQTTLTGLAQQNQIGAASSLIGKAVAGLDANSNSTSGIVSSVNVASSGVTLSLSNGGSMTLANVTSIAPAPTTDTGASTTSTTPAAN